MEKISERINLLRNLEGESQKELALVLDVAQSAISQWESGINEPKACYIIKLSQHYNVPTDFLLGITDNEGNKAHEEDFDYFDGTHKIHHTKK